MKELKNIRVRQTWLSVKCVPLKIPREKLWLGAENRNDLGGCRWLMTKRPWTVEDS